MEDIIKKICTKCGVEKTLDCYYKSKRGKFGVFGCCKDCRDKQIEEYRKNNTSKVKEATARYYQLNKERLSESSKATRAKYRLNNKDKIYQYRLSNKHNQSKLHAEWYQKNKEYYKKYQNKYRRYKTKTDINFKLRMNLRNRVRDALKSNSKSTSTIELIGCSIEELKIHLQSKFTEGMSWDNHGFYGWHIDHILPCASFDLTDPEQQKKCFHYTNLQPLWWKDNLSKSDKILNQSSTAIHFTP